MITAGDEEIPGAWWTGLFTGDYPDDEALVGFASETMDEPTRALNDVAQPHLANILEPNDFFAHLSIVRDRFLGHHSYLAVAAHRDVSAELDRLSRFYAEKWTRYVEEAVRRTPSATGYTRWSG